MTVGCTLLAAHGTGKNRFHFLVYLNLLASECLLERKRSSHAYNAEKAPQRRGKGHQSLKFEQAQVSACCVFWIDVKDGVQEEQLELFNLRTNSSMASSCPSKLKTREASGPSVQRMIQFLLG